MQGWRKDMEDQHIVTQLPSLPDHVFLAVFDGHGGKGAAIFAERQMISVISSTQGYSEYVDSTEKDPKDLGVVLTAAFMRIDVMLRAHQESISRSDSSGCTAVCCVVTPNYYICANTGDSRCVLGTKGGAVPMSYDHKPTDAEERERILNAGGTVRM